MAAIVEAQKQAEPIGSLEQATGGASNKIGDGLKAARDCNQHRNYCMIAAATLSCAVPLRC